MTREERDLGYVEPCSGGCGTPGALHYVDNDLVRRHLVPYDTTTERENTMTDQTTATSEPDSDGWPPVRFALRNVHGRNPEIELNVHTLGLERYLLVTTGDTAVQLEASHMDMSTVAETLSFLCATALQAEQTSPESRESAVAMILASTDELGPTEGHRRVMRDVTAERHRQVDKGWTPEHDDEHALGDMCELAVQRFRRAFDVPEDQTRPRLIEGIAILAAAVEALDRRQPS